MIYSLLPRLCTSTIKPSLRACFACQVCLYHLMQLSSRFTHAQVWQVRNPSLWQKYRVHKRVMKEKLGKDTERWLWHGAAEEAIVCINKDGFNRSYSGLHGTRTCTFRVEPILVRITHSSCALIPSLTYFTHPLNPLLVN